MEKWVCSLMLRKSLIQFKEKFYQQVFWLAFMYSVEYQPIKNDACLEYDGGRDKNVSTDLWPH